MFFSDMWKPASFPKLAKPTGQAVSLVNREAECVAPVSEENLPEDVLPLRLYGDGAEAHRALPNILGGGSVCVCVCEFAFRIFHS